MTQQKKTMRH